MDGISRHFPDSLRRKEEEKKNQQKETATKLFIFLKIQFRDLSYFQIIDKILPSTKIEKSFI